MIIHDLSGTLFATVAVMLRDGKTEVEEGMLRHMILNSIRANKKKFEKEFGEYVIACDSREGYWRRDVFPYYKKNRHDSREASKIDWKSVFEITNKVTEELMEFFPYRVVRVAKAEADDVIAVLAKKYHSQGVLILSRDHDMAQLQTLPGIKQWDPVSKKWCREKDPVEYLKTHIITGDAGDGVPSILEKDNALVLPEILANGKKKRRASITQKRIAAWKAGEPQLTMTTEEYRNWVRNREMVDLSYIPEDIQNAILENYEAQEGKDRSQLFNYFISKRLRNLMDAIGDF